jgi:hypothetical protein
MPPHKGAACKAYPPRSREAILDKLDSEPALANEKVERQDQRQIRDTHWVGGSERQHDLALRIAQSYAGDRKIVDKIKIRGQA